MVEIDTLFQTKTAKKNPFGAAHTYTAYIRDYPPPPSPPLPPSGAKNALQIMTLAAYARETKKSEESVRIQHLANAQNRGTQRRFPHKCIENPFKVIQSTLRHQECILSGAIKFVSVRSSKENMSLFEITRAAVLFSRQS